MMSASTALARALKLAGRGLSVFPCAVTKRPTCPHGFKEATRDATAVRALWRDYPGPLIGVPTGAVTGIFVLDVDTAKHDTAAEWLERHAPYLPETRSHLTQSGGRHLLFKHRPGLRNTQAKLALGVDTRAEGGYVLWWPAAIEHGHHRAPLAELPDWLVEALTPPKPETRPVFQRPKTPSAAKAKIEGIVGAVATATEGQRNSLAYWGACRLAELVKQAVIAQGDAIAIAIEAGRQAGLSPKEAQRTVASAFRGRS
jgi:Bifunctional DNA primase/polymerase, N-terminal